MVPDESGEFLTLSSRAAWDHIEPRLTESKSLRQDTQGQKNHSSNEESDATLPALFQHEAADRAFFILGPHHKDVGEGRVVDPHLVAGQAGAFIHTTGTGDHAGRVGAVVGFSEADAANVFASGEPGQVLLLRGHAAELEDEHHHQRGLQAHHEPVAGVDPLNLARDQAVAHVFEARAAVLLGDGGAEQPQRAPLAEDAGIGGCGRSRARGELASPGSTPARRRERNAHRR